MYYFMSDKMAALCAVVIFAVVGLSNLIALEVIAIERVDNESSNRPIIQGSNEWKNMYPSTSPPAASGTGLAYDSKSDKVILFGGWDTHNPKDETWAYDYSTNNWTNMNPSKRPSPRPVHAMAYDSQSDRVILFGEAQGTLEETWAYDFNSNTWTNMSPLTHPIGGGMMVYDSKSDRAILYSDTDIPRQTWTYDFNSNTWTNMSPSQPINVISRGFAYDSQSDRSILFGEEGGYWQGLETWAYDFKTNAWTNMTSSSQPPKYHDDMMAYDAQSDRIVLYAGKTSGSGETWTYDYDNNHWTNMYPSSGPAIYVWYAMTYNSKADKVMLYGGADSMMNGIRETWTYELDGTGAPSVSSTSPQNGATNVLVNANIQITFSAPMDKPSSEGAISASPPISGTFSWDADMKGVILDPSTDLSANTQYTITIATGAKSQAGVNIASPYSFSFTTGGGGNGAINGGFDLMILLLILIVIIIVIVVVALAVLRKKKQPQVYYPQPVMPMQQYQPQPQPSPPPPQVINCMNCHNTIPPDAMLCPYCGYRRSM